MLFATKLHSGPERMNRLKQMELKASYNVYRYQLNNNSSCQLGDMISAIRSVRQKSLNFVIWQHDCQSKRPL